ncbi:polyubiquitin-like [Acipenser oxyrinchus oxyrinchus]|uniref:Polyubiquitin-like n=1 Tax=Acipenser oxyrinchus oxyrinchus TaxID=40147 RepID=A0AAD8CWB0_ACIOX|nr:polyubiquitin-like [Acipenser oxyrinchus oxyrinchus]
MGKIYQIYVIGVEGKRMTIDVGESEEALNDMTVLAFKKLLLQKLPGSESAEDIRLLFGSKQLEDTDKFSAHEIKDKSTVVMVLRLPGGEDGNKPRE